MRLIAVDCATVQAAVAVMDCSAGSTPILVSAKLLKLKKGGDSLGSRLIEFRKQLIETISETAPTHAAVEDLYFNKFLKNPRSISKVLLSIGVAVEVLAEYVAEPELLAATTVRSRLQLKKKIDTWNLVNKVFSDQLAELGYPKGILKTHNDISDAIALGWVAQAALQ